MIVYQASKQRFLDDTFKHDIETIILAAMRLTGRNVGAKEIESWRASLQSMAKVLNDDEIPADAGVAIEYTIPPTSKRVDFILTGRSAESAPTAVIVELKQWTEARRTDQDGVIKTWLGSSERDVSHPSYQAWAYAELLRNFNEGVYANDITLRPCAYLHNYERDDHIGHEFYETYLERAPLFLKGETERNRLRAFIKRHVRFGDKTGLIYQIENGRIRPSKMLADSLVGMMKGKQEFVLIDDQKVVYEAAAATARRSVHDGKKRVVIVEGGPGSGKSVVAINLLVALTANGQTCRYVSKNAAPRTVYEQQLTGEFRKTVISNLFSGSGAFTDVVDDSFDTLVVDEAHRLNEKSGLYGNLGDHQVKEIIRTAKCSIFFVDDDQRVTTKDVGDKATLRLWAKELGAQVTELTLESQFRCNGAEGYLAWLNHVLDVRPSANDVLDTRAFDLQVFDSPQALHEAIRKKNEASNKARVVAGYCWNWVSKRDPKRFDIEIPGHDYRRRWNLASDGSLWIVAKQSVEEVGCVHTSQGLEVDHVGVIIGPDLVVRNGRILTRPEHRARTDQSLKGFRKLLKGDPDAAREQADRIIKNTYRTLLTRGMKGCYVFCTDPETNAYFRSKIVPSHFADTEPVAVEAARKATVSTLPPAAPEPATATVLPFLRVARLDGENRNAVPLLDLKVAAGSFSGPQAIDVLDLDWAELPEWIRAQPGYFVAQVVGESMNRRIPNGAWCLFRLDPQGSRNGKVVVAQHRTIHDPDTGGSFTVKLYASEKAPGEDDAWTHSSIVLRPDSSDPSFQPIRIPADSAEDFRIVAELVTVLG